VTWSPARGSVVNVRAGTKDNRPGVVYWVETSGVVDVYFVAWGTGTPPDDRRRNRDPFDPNVAVEKDSPDGDALALDKDTWFYPKEMGPFELSDVSPRPNAGPCPRAVLDRITKLHRSR
jgi:hypothetical protein